MIPQTGTENRVAPIEHPTYLSVRAEAALAGVEDQFRFSCCLIQARADLLPLTLVFKNLAQIVEQIRTSWHGVEHFSEVREATGWFFSNLSTLERVAKTRFDTEPRERTRGGIRVFLHPMDGFGLTSHSLFSMLCDVHEVPELTPMLRFLQAHMLVARETELIKQRAHNPGGYADLYERNSGQKDFARNVRSPYPASHAARQLSKLSCAKLLRHMHPERTPEEFAKALTHERIPPSVDGFDFAHILTTIKNYCLVKSSSNAGGTRVRETDATPPWRSSYIEYNETRFGTQLTLSDEHDESLEVPNQEWVRDRPVDIQTALEEDSCPDELATPGGYILDGTDQDAGGGPLTAGRNRARRYFNEIDVLRMPWSAAHLRPNDIEANLVPELTAIAAEDGFQKEESLLRLAYAAIVVTCIETGRTPAQSMNLAFGPVPAGDLTFIPGRPSQWCIHAIQPLYREQRPTQSGEISPVTYLFYPVHFLAERILVRFSKLRKRAMPTLSRFDQPTLEREINRWLRSLDASGRLTTTKLSRLKLTLIAAAAGGDIGQASLALGVPHPDARVSLYYLLISVERAEMLYQRATEKLWNGYRHQTKVGAAQ